ncbi:hypothetical protein [Devosia ginsengisoli]|uniref:hypothetical protein n=1 Tax=Devosia ginsengisoli TaxID=400770 RepID=UPI0026F10D7D|nr:hypothetical protein [Devosia ginsengisoli]MCR6670989.1 hypothetical protein [Devosia ginsengisoli]
MANVPSDVTDLKRAFGAHRQLEGNLQVSRRSRVMALFYAAECGLKCVLMASANLTNVMDLKPIFKTKYGKSDLHDIEALCIEASILPSDVGATPSDFVVNGATFASYRIHEAARYGVKLPDIYLVAVENWLRNIATQVSLRI